jgi:hypothetical protein
MLQKPLMWFLISWNLLDPQQDFIPPTHHHGFDSCLKASVFLWPALEYDTAAAASDTFLRVLCQDILCPLLYFVL